MPSADGRLRVLHVLGRLEPHGTERQLVGLLRAAHGRHWDATLCVLRPGYPMVGEMTAAGVPVRELPQWGDADPRRLLALRHYAAARRCDVVHSSLWGANVLTRLAVLGPRRPAVVISERSVEDFRSGAGRLVDRALRPATEHYLANSRGVADFVRRAHRVPPERVSVVRNGLDAALFHPGASPAGDQRPLRIGTVGRLARVKGHDVLLAALPHVLASPSLAGRAVEVEIAGEGPERAALQAAAAGLPVRLLGELSEPAAVATFLRSLDVFVMPSRWEGLPNAVLEAVACGLPVVASDVPGMAEAAGAAARLVPAEAPGALAAALLAALAGLGEPADPAARPPTRTFEQVAMEHLAVFRAAYARRHGRPAPPHEPPRGQG